MQSFVEKNPQKSTRRPSEEIGTPKDIKYCQIETLGKSYRSCRSVPHELTPQQVQNRVYICQHILGNPMDDRFIKRIVTCDENWVYYRKFDASKQWLRPRQPAKIIVKRNQFGPKVMLWDSWNVEGVVHWEFVPNGSAVDTAIYSQQLERVHDILRQRYPALVNRNRVLLLQDNARPHIARKTMIRIQELGGIELLPHPAYIPDLAPSDYHLFQSMTPFLRTRNFKILKLWKWVSPNSSHQKP